MKKVFFGCMLMLTGIIGGSSWLIAESNLIQPGAWSSMLNLKSTGSIIIILFYVLAVVGGIIAIKALKEDK